jgi:hypothetical protein
VLSNTTAPASSKPHPGAEGLLPEGSRAVCLSAQPGCSCVWFSHPDQSVACTLHGLPAAPISRQDCSCWAHFLSAHASYFDAGLSSVVVDTRHAARLEGCMTEKRGPGVLACSSNILLSVLFFTALAVVGLVFGRGGRCADPEVWGVAWGCPSPFWALLMCRLVSEGSDGWVPCLLGTRRFIARMSSLGPEETG